MLSAVLFCVALSVIIFKTEEECDDSGYSIGGQILSNLGYADDIALMNKDIDKLQAFLSCLSKNAKEIGLEVNIKKTKSLTTDKLQPELNFRIDGIKLEQVTEFIYLGHKISSSNNHEVAVKHRIGLGWAAFGKHEQLIKSKRIPIHIKSKIYLT